MFSLLVIGVSGNETSSDALSGLVPFLGEKIMFIGGLFGLVAVAASFLVLGNYLKNSLRYDYKIPSFLAASIAVFAPLVLFLLGFREFIAVIGIVGIIVGVIEGIVIVLLYRAAKEKGQREPEYSLSIPKFVSHAVIGILVVGTLVELFF